MEMTDTYRASRGWVAEVFASEDGVGERCLDALADLLDGGEGWVVRETGRLTWFFGVLAAEFAYLTFDDPTHSVPNYLSMEISMVRNVEALGPDVFEYVNSLNIQSAGWVVWIDSNDRSIKLSSRIPLHQSHWWWLEILGNTVPLAAAVALANAYVLPIWTKGEPAIVEHPSRGLREVEDEWLTEARQGIKNPPAIIGLPMTGYEVDCFRETLERMRRVSNVEIGWPLESRVFMEGGVMVSQLFETWHDEFGFGWKVASLPPAVRLADLRSEDQHSGLILAAEMNEDLLKSNNSIPILGGWAQIEDFDVIRSMFLPAFALELVAVNARSSMGAVAGQIQQWFETSIVRPDIEMVEADTVEEFNDDFYLKARSVLADFPRSRWTTCFDPFSMLTEEAEHGPDDPWLAPRHKPICTFGFFHPKDPVVVSLEYEFTLEGGRLFEVVRRPFNPSIQQIGICPIGEIESRMPSIVEEALASGVDGPLNVGPDWFVINTHFFESAALAGLRRFAALQPPDVLINYCQRILASDNEPWKLTSQEDNPKPPLPKGDVDALWVELITKPDVVFGHQFFLRSVWEGAKAFAETDGDADKTGDHISDFLEWAAERLAPDMEYRNYEGFEIQHPTTAWDTIADPPE